MYINPAILELLSADGGITIPNYTFDCPYLSKRFALDRFLNLSNNEDDELSRKFANAMKVVDGE